MVVAAAAAVVDADVGVDVVDQIYYDVDASIDLGVRPVVDPVAF